MAVEALKAELGPAMRADARAPAPIAVVQAAKQVVARDATDMLAILCETIRHLSHKPTSSMRAIQTPR